MSFVFHSIKLCASSLSQIPPHTASQTDLSEICLFLPNLWDNLPESVSIHWSVRSLKEDSTQYSKCRWLSGNWNSQTNKSQNSHNIISQKPISDGPFSFELPLSLPDPPRLTLCLFLCLSMRDSPCGSWPFAHPFLSLFLSFSEVLCRG